MPITLMPASVRDLDLSSQHFANGLALGFGDPEDGDFALREILLVVESIERKPPWGTYWVCCEGQAAFAGLCGFKAEPDGSSLVEIFYYTMPKREGQGIASGAVAALVAIARRGSAQCVIAHTLPEPNASGTILVRNGFRFEGQSHDPEDGIVWRWSLPLG